MKRIPSLDGLRAISIIFVLLAHLSGTRNCFASSILSPYGNFGVRVFFVISGFLITSLLLQERTKTGTINLKQFYIRRALRIFPAAYVFIIFAIATHWSRLSPANVVMALTYTSNYCHSGHWITGHLWSLSVEEQFYLLWPVVLVACFRSRKSILLFSIASGPIFRIVFWYLWGYKGLEYPFPVVMDALAMGCLLAVLRTRLRTYDRVLQGKVFVIVPLVTVAIPVLQIYANRLYQTLGLTFMHAGIALCIDQAIEQKYRLLNTRVMSGLGMISYSLYLWQEPFLNRTITSWYTSFPENVVLAISCAALSYYLVERPVLVWRDKVLSSRRAQRVQRANNSLSVQPIAEGVSPIGQ